MAKTVFALGCALILTACPMPPPASERATDAARDANVAARFGRIDLAVGATTPAAREEFLRRRATWGSDIRIVDVELGGLSMPDSDHAIFQVDYAWMRMDEDTLRSTRVTQRWTSSKGSWVLEGEKRATGDIGLFGEHVEVLRPPQRDAQFATKVIRED
jgi:starvation-inducible outer membrane lipoprotein